MAMAEITGARPFLSLSLSLSLFDVCARTRILFPADIDKSLQIQQDRGNRSQAYVIHDLIPRARTWRMQIEKYQVRH